ncbi:glycosyltransferase [Mesorhizobium sp. M0013]|uniref:glycosyltransferase n=1 Tax=Mesorhizobium sp. M0013 TaxID=2956841 RepID=UPI00333D095C
MQGKIPCEGYGGTQRQIDWLASKLVSLGHEVTVIAGPGSRHPLCEVRQASTPEECAAAIPGDADIVHFNGWYELSGPYRALYTLHGYVPNTPREGQNFSFVSASHARRHNRATFVHNGFPVDAYRIAGLKNDRLLFLGGIARAGKGLNLAVDLAKKFNFGLDIAGGSRWKLLGRSQTRKEGVFFKSISGRFHFTGVIDGAEKLRFLGEAKAFLNPISWEEPFGMAPVEAMLCGTPVLTTPRGALPETVDAETGRFFETDEDFARGLNEVGSISPQRCRESAADRFPIDKTAKAYVALYQRILDGETLP